MKKKLFWTSIITIAVLGVVLAGVGLYLRHLVMGLHFTNEEVAYVYIDTDDNLDSIRTKALEAGNPKECWALTSWPTTINCLITYTLAVTRLATL